MSNVQTNVTQGIQIQYWLWIELARFYYTSEPEADILSGMYIKRINHLCPDIVSPQAAVCLPFLFSTDLRERGDQNYEYVVVWLPRICSWSVDIYSFIHAFGSILVVQKPERIIISCSPQSLSSWIVWWSTYTPASLCNAQSIAVFIDPTPLSAAHTIVMALHIEFWWKTVILEHLCVILI